MTADSTLTVKKKGTFKRVGNNIDGFVIEGNTDNSKLFYVYHNASNTLDAVNYGGRQQQDTNIMNRKGISDLIDSKITSSKPADATQSTKGIAYLGQANTGTSTNPTLKRGQLYFNSSQKTLIIGN